MKDMGKRSGLYPMSVYLSEFSVPFPFLKKIRLLTEGLQKLQKVSVSLTEGLLTEGGWPGCLKSRIPGKVPVSYRIRYLI